MSYDADGDPEDPMLRDFAIVVLVLVLVIGLGVLVGTC